MEMPDLPFEEKYAEMRKSLRFWVSRCSDLEKEVKRLKVINSELSAEVSRLSGIAKY
jgi:hypothetical protein